MTIIDGSGSHVFNEQHVRGFDNRSKEKRAKVYTNIDIIKSESVIGFSRFVTIQFMQLDETLRDTLNEIFYDNNITSMTTIDEVLVGEDYTIYTGVTNPIFIETKTFNPRKSKNSKDILYYQSRLKFRFDTITIDTKV